MAIALQKTGFGRFEVGELARVYRIDTRAAWVGHQIKDALCVSLRENAERLGKVSFVGSRDVLVCVDARKVFVWKVKLAKDGDTYERQSETNERTRGSLKLLRAAYGARVQITVTDEKGAAKLIATKKADKGTLAFYSLAHLIASEKKVSKGKVNKRKGAKDEDEDDESDE